jgi:hypothetical protein
MTTFTAVDGLKIEGAQSSRSCTDNDGVPFPYLYRYGTERTPITLISAGVPFLKRNTKGTERNTSTHHQLCNFGIQKVEMALSLISYIQDK